MTCADHRQFLESGSPESTSEKAQEAAAHAEGCPNCAAEARAEAELARSLAAWEDCRPPEGLARRALALCPEAPVQHSPRSIGVQRAWWGAVSVAPVLACGAWLLFARPAPAPPRSALTPQQARALAALSRAGRRVLIAQQKSTGALALVVRYRKEKP